MALVIETGAGVPGADSYVDLAYALAYHAARNNAAWASATDSVREAALRNATQYIDGKYNSRWKGVRINALQARQWPRLGVVLDTVRGSSSLYDAGFTHGLLPSDTVPDRVKQAVCELALRALAAALAPDLPRGGLIKNKTVDVLSTTYMDSAPGHTVYQFIDMLLADFLNSRNQCSLVRA